MVNGYGRCHIYSLPYAFECSFVRSVSQWFPCLKGLRIKNFQPQQNKESSSTTPIIFPRLLFVTLQGHEDYAEQFLVYDKCRLPSLVGLDMNYESLVKVTNNFTNETTRRTCAQITILFTTEGFVRNEKVNKYFPLLN